MLDITPVPRRTTGAFALPGAAPGDATGDTIAVYLVKGARTSAAEVQGCAAS